MASASVESVKIFSAAEFFAKWQEILKELIYSTFGGVDTRQRKECMEKFALDVEAAATSLCVENGIPTAEREETEKQLRYTTSMLLPTILLTVFCAGHEPGLTGTTESFLEKDAIISLIGHDSGEAPELVSYCNSRLDLGDCFLRAGDCQGEVYLLPGAGVFKPEVTKMATTLLRDGFRGSEHRREIAAFKVDQAYGGFARVPPTVPVTIPADSLPDREDAGTLVSGSLQKWVKSVCSSEDMGSSRFNTNDIHHIGILDVLLYNTDRHGGNILVSKTSTCSKARLVPIDHGLCLPDFRHLDQAEYEWLYWKQAQQPFSTADLKLIASFDGDEVAGILREQGLSSGSVLTARVMVAVLQQTAITRGWNLQQVGKFCTKPFNAKSSALQDVVSATVAAVDLQNDDVAFEDHDMFIDSFKQQLKHQLDGKITV